MFGRSYWLRISFTPTAFEVEFVNLCLSLCVESLRSQFADVNPRLPNSAREKEFAVQFIFMLTDAGLDGRRRNSCVACSGIR